MKKLFALFVVAALAAVGCDDKKSTSPTGKTSPTAGPGTVKPTSDPGPSRSTPADVTTPGAVKTTPPTKVTPDKDKGKNGPDLPK